MGMPPGQRPEFHLSTSGPSPERTSFNDTPAYATRPVVASNTPLNMATELRMPRPARFSPHMPSQRIQLPPIFPYPATTMTYTPPRPDQLQESIIVPAYSSPYAQPLPPLLRPGPPLRNELPLPQSPEESRSSSSPSLVPSASSPTNFELPLSRKRSHDQAIFDHDRHVWLMVFGALSWLTFTTEHHEMLHAQKLRQEQKVQEAILGHYHHLPTHQQGVQDHTYRVLPLLTFLTSDIPSPHPPLILPNSVLEVERNAADFT
jgi:hypothetical protein